MTKSIFTTAGVGLALLVATIIWSPGRPRAAATAPTATPFPFVTSTPTPGEVSDTPTPADTIVAWDTPEPPTPTATPKFVIANVGEWTTSTRSNKTIFRATKMEANPKWLKARPPKDAKFVAVNVEYYNVTTQTTYLNSGLGKYFLVDEEGHMVDFDRAHSTFPPINQYAAMTPGSTAQFSVVFQVPAKAKADKMFYTYGTDRTIVVDLTHVVPERDEQKSRMSAIQPPRPAAPKQEPLEDYNNPK